MEGVKKIEKLQMFCSYLLVSFVSKILTVIYIPGKSRLVYSNGVICVRGRLKTRLADEID